MDYFLTNWPMGKQ